MKTRRTISANTLLQEYIETLKFVQSIGVSKEVGDVISNKLVNLEEIENITFSLNVERKTSLRSGNKSISDELLLELYKVTKKQYEDDNFEYINLEKDKYNIKTIANKLSEAMKQNNFEVTDNTLLNSYKIFFNKIPSWWKENAYTLKSINKNFVKIYNQIKNGEQKRDGGKSNAKPLDYSKFVGSGK